MTTFRIQNPASTKFVIQNPASITYVRTDYFPTYNPYQKKIMHQLKQSLEERGMYLQSTNTSEYLMPVSTSATQRTLFDYSPDYRLYLRHQTNIYDINEEPLSYLQSLLSSGDFIHPPSCVKTHKINKGYLALSLSHPKFHYAYYTNATINSQIYDVTIEGCDFLPLGKYTTVKDSHNLYRDSGESFSKALERDYDLGFNVLTSRGVDNYRVWL